MNLKTNQYENRKKRLTAKYHRSSLYHQARGLWFVFNNKLAGGSLLAQTRYDTVLLSENRIAWCHEQADSYEEQAFHRFLKFNN